jgi:hypothetical protein
MSPKEKVLSHYPAAYCRGGLPPPGLPWAIYPNLDHYFKPDGIVLGRGNSGAHAWNQAARSGWMNEKSAAHILGVSGAAGETFSGKTPLPGKDAAA